MRTLVLILIAAGLIWAAAIFLGLIHIYPSTFKKSPPSDNSSQSLKQQQRDTINDTEQKRRKLMEDMKQKISDSKNKRY